MKNKIITISLITLFSIILWGFITLSKEYNYRIKSEIKIESQNPEFQVINEGAKFVDLKLKGKGLALFKIALGKTPDFKVNLTSNENNQVLLGDFIEENNWITHEILVDEITPQIVKFKIEKVASKTVKIIPDVKIETKSGYMISSKIELTPDTVRISGPKSLVNKIKNIKTQYFEFNNIEQNIEQIIELEKIPNLNYKKQKVKISFDVQQIVDKIFSNIKVHTVSVPMDRHLIIYPSKIKVVLRGGIDFLSKLPNDSINASIKYLDAVIDSTGTLAPEIKIPKFSKFIRTIPDRLEYIIKRN